MLNDENGAELTRSRPTAVEGERDVNVRQKSLRSPRSELWRSFNVRTWREADLSACRREIAAFEGTIIQSRVAVELIDRFVNRILDGYSGSSPKRCLEASSHC
jgi:hypothetical protein